MKANTLRQLRAENESRAYAVPIEDRERVERVITYLKSATLSEWDIQTVRRDLFGMAGEAYARGESFSEQIGDEKTFCESVLQTIRRKNRVLEVLAIPFYISLIVFIISFLGFSRDGYMYLTDVLYAAVLMAITYGASSIIKRKTFFMNTWIKWILLIVYAIAGAVLAVTLRVIPLFNVPLIPLTPLVTGISGAFCLLYALLYWFIVYKRRKGSLEGHK